MRFAAYTVFVFVMMVCATIIVVSPHIGLGDYEQFFLYQALGISRRHALAVPLSLIAIAIVYGYSEQRHKAAAEPDAGGRDLIPTQSRLARHVSTVVRERSSPLFV